MTKEEKNIILNVYEDEVKMLELAESNISRSLNSKTMRKANIYNMNSTFERICCIEQLMSLLKIDYEPKIGDWHK